jgi:hypothetical protein
MILEIAQTKANNKHSPTYRGNNLLLGYRVAIDWRSDADDIGAEQKRKLDDDKQVLGRLDI